MEFGRKMFSKLLSFFNKSTQNQFDHKKAQAYELSASKKWLKRNFLVLYPEVMDKTKQKSVISDEWFSNQSDWQTFIDWTEGKTGLEIGSGPMGTIVRWWWIKQRIIMDPLIAEYKKLQFDLFGKTCFSEDIELLAINAEDFKEDLESCVDGVIICRNTLDHCKNPMKILINISKYAKPGAYLLLWTDIYHIKGHDQGHTNITSDIEEFVRNIEDLGFNIEYKTPVKSDRDTIHYGCRARKKV
jgi:hypothetical protein